MNIKYLAVEEFKFWPNALASQIENTVNILELPKLIIQ